MFVTNSIASRCEHLITLAKVLITCSNVCVSSLYKTVQYASGISKNSSGSRSESRICSSAGRRGLCSNVNKWYAYHKTASNVILARSTKSSGKPCPSSCFACLPANEFKIS